MRVRPAFIAAAALLAACDGGVPSGEEPTGPLRTGEPASENAQNTGGDLSPAQVGDLPRPGDGLRFIGKWAAEQDLCERAAWQFTETTLRTPGGSVCSFDRVTEVPGGYDIQATCTAEGPPTSDILQIRFAESAKAMLFESETIAGSSLLFCGRDV